MEWTTQQINRSEFVGLHGKLNLDWEKENAPMLTDIFRKISERNASCFQLYAFFLPFYLSHVFARKILCVDLQLTFFFLPFRNHSKNVS